MAIREGLTDAVSGVRFHTPLAPELSAGVLVFALPGVSHGEVFQEVYETHRLACTGRGGAFDGIRLSPHIYNTLGEVERAVEALAAHV